ERLCLGRYRGDHRGSPRGHDGVRAAGVWAGPGPDDGGRQRGGGGAGPGGGGAGDRRGRARADAEPADRGSAPGGAVGVRERRREGLLPARRGRQRPVRCGGVHRVPRDGQDVQGDPPAHDRRDRGQRTADQWTTARGDGSQRGGAGVAGYPDRDGDGGRDDGRGGQGVPGAGDRDGGGEAGDRAERGDLPATGGHEAGDHGGGGAGGGPNRCRAALPAGGTVAVGGGLHHDAAVRPGGTDGGDRADGGAGHHRPRGDALGAVPDAVGGAAVGAVRAGELVGI
ncbi:MAG: D-aminopeptidase dipeptide-binding protein DppA, partial [uncultured Thermomicrobiales bacterium]